MSQHNEAAIRIDITGKIHCGKSMIAAKIAQALHDAFAVPGDGVSNHIEVGVYNLDGDFTHVMSRMQECDFSLAKVSALRVDIVDRNLPYVDPTKDALPGFPEEHFVMNAKGYQKVAEVLSAPTRPLDRLKDQLQEMGVDAQIIHVNVVSTTHYHLRHRISPNNALSTSPTYIDYVFDYQGEFLYTALHHADH